MCWYPKEKYNVIAVTKCNFLVEYMQYMSFTHNEIKNNNKIVIIIFLKILQKLKTSISAVKFSTTQFLTRKTKNQAANLLCDQIPDKLKKNGNLGFYKFFWKRRVVSVWKLLCGDSRNRLSLLQRLRRKTEMEVWG